LKIAIEGDPELLNRYNVIELNPEKHPNAKLAPAHWLATWLTTPPGQEAIGAFRLDGEELFHPSAANPK
jgi:tungstate transport system substrate-binding protein